MHDRDRVFYLILTWSTIPAALIVSCAIAWASGQLSMGWSVSGIVAGFLGMAAATIYALQKKPPAPRYPGPVIIGIACLTWALIGWQAWTWSHPPIPPTQPVQTQGYTQAQLEDAKAKAVQAATKPILEKLDQANSDNATLRQSIPRQVNEALNKAAAQFDTPVSIDKLPTSLRVLFKGSYTNANSIEEIETKNLVWTKLVALQSQTYTHFIFGQQSNTFPVWAIILIFKKPIIYKDIRVDDHGVGLPKADITIDPRYAIIEFNSGPQDGLVDLIATNEPSK